MTDVQKNNSRKISTYEEARALYAAPPASMANRVGLEVEMGVFTLDGREVVIPGPDKMLELQDALKSKGHDAQLEAAGVLEYASPAAPVENFGRLLPILQNDLYQFREEIARQGLALSPYAILPTTSREEALDKMASRERLVTSINAMKEIFPPATIEIPLLTTGVQASFSPASADAMFAMMRRAYILTPLLIAFSNSHAGFVGNDETPIDKNYRMDLYSGYGRAGGISQAFFAATNGKTLIDAHIAQVFMAPMHFAYGRDGELISASAEKPITFAGLIEQGLNTQSNYELAESFLYNDIKICNLRDEKGQTVGKRIEVRAMDAGPSDQASRALLLTASVVPSGPMADNFEALAARYGFEGSPADMADLLRSSRHAAIHHKGNFTDIPFGTGRMLDFMRELADLLAAGHRQRNDINPGDTAALCTKLRVGLCQAEATAKAYSSLDALRGKLVKQAEAALAKAGKKPAAEGVSEALPLRGLKR